MSEAKKSLRLQHGYVLIGEFILKKEFTPEDPIKRPLDCLGIYAVVQDGNGAQETVYLLRIVYNDIRGGVEVEIANDRSVLVSSLFWESEKAIYLLTKELLWMAGQPEFKIFDLKELVRQICAKVIHDRLLFALSDFSVKRTTPQMIRAIAALLNIDPSRIGILLKIAAKCG